LAQRFFQKRGVESEIVDAGHLRYERGQLLIEDRPIDLVYNRLVDFLSDLASIKPYALRISRMPSWFRRTRMFMRSSQTSAI